MNSATIAAAGAAPGHATASLPKLDGKPGIVTIVLFVTLLLIGLLFEFVNGFHDTANAVQP